MAFQLNEVIIPFKATVDAAIKGIERLKVSMTDLGKAFKKADDAINGQSVDKFGNKLKDLDFRTLRMIDRLALLVVMSKNVKLGLDQMFGSTSMVAKGFESASEGLMIFTSLAGLAKDRMGQIAAGITGLTAAALLFLADMMRERVAATGEATVATMEAEKSVKRYGNALEDANTLAETFGDTWGEVYSRKLQLARTSMETMLQRIRDINVEIEKLKKKRDTASSEGAIGLNQQIGALNYEMSNLQHQIRDIKTVADLDQALARVGEIVDRVRDLRSELNKLAAQTPEMQMVAKILSPGAAWSATSLQEKVSIDVAMERMRLTERLLRGLMEQARIIDTELSGINPATATPQQHMRMNELRSMRPTTEISEYISKLLAAQKDLNAALAPGEFTKSFTIPFTNAIGDAVINGFIQGKKGAEILADFMTNLFTAGLNNIMKHFQQGMIDVFKAIAGSGGELLGSALMAVIGVVAGVLSKRASSNDSFERIKNQIESTQAVRGVVAGPTNIAIAAVGENLRRAMVGVEQRLDVIIRLLMQGNQNTIPFAGSVATAA